MTETHPTTEEWLALYGTFPDGSGARIDWSGVTAVGVCLMCSHVSGICFDIEDARAEMRRHRALAHPDEMWREGGECRVPGCPKERKVRGLCYGHASEAKRTWANTFGPWCDAWECDRGAILGGLCEMHDHRQRRGINVYEEHTARKSGPKPAPKPKSAPRFVNKGQTCAEDGCDKSAVAKGLCQPHYKRHLSGTKPEDRRAPVTPFEPPLPPRAHAADRATAKGQTCHVEGCDRPVLARLLCQRHYAYTKKQAKKMRGPGA